MAVNVGLISIVVVEYTHLGSFVKSQVEGKLEDFKATYLIVTDSKSK